MDAILKTEHISYAVGDQQLISDITLEIPRGSFVGLVGPNGSGKSTLLKTIYRVHRANQGTVYLNSREMTQLSNREIARQMAVVTQEHHIHFDFSVLELMQIGRYAHSSILSKQKLQDEAKCREALAMVGMEQFADRSFQNLSGGEKQRVLIASAFSRDAELVVLDEPTNHLDIGHQFLIMDLMKSRKDLTVFSSVHDLNIAMGYCDYVIALEHGHVAAVGKPREILTRELVERLFRVRVNLCETVDGVPYIQYLGTLL